MTAQSRFLANGVVFGGKVTMIPTQAVVGVAEEEIADFPHFRGMRTDGVK